MTRTDATKTTGRVDPDGRRPEKSGRGRLIPAPYVRLDLPPRSSRTARSVSLNKALGLLRAVFSIFGLLLGAETEWVRECKRAEVHR